MKKALVLLSGGLDSTTALYVAKEQGFDELYAITFEYGQKHDKEIKAAKAVAKAAGVKEHKFVKIMLNQWDGCSLTDEKMDIHDGDINRTTIPDTYVPARNMVFLSVAASYADALDITDILSGSAKWIIPGTWTAGRNSSVPWNKRSTWEPFSVPRKNKKSPFTLLSCT